MIGTWSRPFRFFYRLYLPIFERIGYKKNAKSLLSNEYRENHI